MSDAGIFDDVAQRVDQAATSAAHTAAQIAAPVYDVLGNVLGWIAQAAAPIIGTSNAVHLVTDVVGHPIGSVVAATNQTVLAAAHASGVVAQAVFDSAGKSLGTLIRDGGQLAGAVVQPAVDEVLGALKWIAIGGGVLLLVWVLLERD